MVAEIRVDAEPDKVQDFNFFLAFGMTPISEIGSFPNGWLPDAFFRNSRLTYIGKEVDKENMLGDFGVRKYNSISGRFNSIDPLWEKYYAWSPYHYCGNNPVNLIDGNGMYITFNENDGSIDAFNEFYLMADMETRTSLDNLNNSDTEYYLSISANNKDGSSSGFNPETGRFEINIDATHSKDEAHLMGVFGDEFAHADLFQNGWLFFFEAGKEAEFPSGIYAVGPSTLADGEIYSKDGFIKAFHNYCNYTCNSMATGYPPHIEAFISARNNNKLSEYWSEYGYTKTEHNIPFDQIPGVPQPSIEKYFIPFGTVYKNETQY